MENADCDGGSLDLVRSSVLFAPDRAVGLVISPTPFVVGHFGTESVLCCSTGRCFCLYDSAKLQLQMSSPRLPHAIRCLAISGGDIYVGLKNKIVSWRRITPVSVFEGHKMHINGILVIGNRLVSFSASEVLVWDRDVLSGSHAALEREDKISLVNNTQWVSESAATECKGHLLARLPLVGDGEITAVLHPDTYINKIVVARGGNIELWNFSTLTRVHVFSCFGSKHTFDNEGRASAVTCLSKSQSPDVIGVGFASGRICVVDLKYDEVLLEFVCSVQQGAVTCLAFRPDGGDSPATDRAAALTAVLVSGCSNGDLLVWSLTEGSLLHVVEHAHSDAVVHAEFLPSQALLFTSGMVYRVLRPPTRGESRVYLYA